MPIREFGCVTCRHIEEHYRHRLDDVTAPLCCGGPMLLLPSRFKVVWTKPLSAYNDPTKENINQCEDGHYAWKVRSSESGHPERVRITSRKEQLDFVKAEGLLDPAECPANADISADGHTLSSQGMPGSWI